MNTDYIEMEYTGIYGNTVILDRGMYSGYRYVIVSYGSHPCAYVEIPKRHPYYKLGYHGEVENTIDVHGGITFDGSLHFKKMPEAAKRYYIGWDYAHCGDYTYYENVKSVFVEDSKKWTVKMIQEDVKNVIEQLLKIGGK